MLLINSDSLDSINLFIFWKKKNW